MKVIKNLVFVIVTLTMLLILMCGFLSVDVGHWYRPIGSSFVTYVLMAIILLVQLVLLAKRLKSVSLKISYPLMIALFMALYFGLCVLFASNRQLKPEGDQLDVLTFTMESLVGQYKGIFKGSYISMFPYQLGLVAYQTVVLRVCALVDMNAIYEMDWAIFYLTLANCALLTYTAAIGLFFFKGKKTALIYMIMMILFVPGFLYGAYIYNDVPSLACAMTSVVCFKLYRRTDKKVYLSFAAIMIGIGTMIRMTAIIFAIAYFLILLFRFLFEERKLAVLALSLLMMIIPALMMKAPLIYYEHASNYEELLGQYGYDLDDGCPYLANIAMSLDIESGQYGWYSGFNKRMHVDVCNFDSSCTLAKAQELLDSSFKTALNEKARALDFMYKKVVSQWCAPDMGAFVETSYEFIDRNSPLNIFYEWNEANLILTCFMKGFMIVVSGLTFLGYLKKKDRPIMDHTLEIIITGGFLFSIIWEAKSRYNLPYVYLLIILAAVYLSHMAESRRS